MPSASVRDDELLAGLGDRGLVVGASLDLDVEHVDLAVERADLAVGPDVDAGVERSVVAGALFEDRPRDEVDVQLARGAARPLHSRALQRLGAGELLGVGAERRPLLRQHAEHGAVGCGGMERAVRGREVGVEIPAPSSAGLRLPAFVLPPPRPMRGEHEG